MDIWHKDRFEDLYKLHFTPVFRYIFLRVKDRGEAEDLTQAVFVKAYQATPPDKKGKALSLNYFFTIARNTVIDHWRKKREVLVDDEEAVFESIPDFDTPEHGALRNEARTDILSALDTLSPSEKEVITLRFMNELSTKEIATLLGKSEPAIRQLQSRGLRSLRESLAKIENA